MDRWKRGFHKAAIVATLIAFALKLTEIVIRIEVTTLTRLIALALVFLIFLQMFGRERESY